MGDIALQRIRENEVAEAVERLRKEYADLRADHRDGSEAGRLWFLSHASYGRIRRIVDKVKEDGLTEATCYASVAAHKDFGWEYGRIKETVRSSEKQWKVGFLQAVIDLWEKVGETVEEGKPLLRPWDD